MAGGTGAGVEALDPLSAKAHDKYETKPCVLKSVDLLSHILYKPLLHLFGVSKGGLMTLVVRIQGILGILTMNRKSIP